VDTEGFTAKTRLGTSICTPAMQSLYFPEGHKENVNIDEEVSQALHETIARVPYRIFHNAAHDTVILPYTKDLPFVCTMIMGHMVDENVMSKGLDYMHKWHCGGEGKQKPEAMQKIIDLMGWEWVPFEMMNAYGDNDAVITMELFYSLKAKYEEQFGPIWNNEDFITERPIK
jgi:hypothetical protein